MTSFTGIGYMSKRRCNTTTFPRSPGQLVLKIIGLLCLRRNWLLVVSRELVELEDERHSVHFC